MARHSILALLLVAATTVLRAAQEPGLFRTGGDTVRVFVTVTDREGRLATALSREQFEIRDNGRAQLITLFDNTPQPVRLIVLVDVSGSMYWNLGLLRNACEQLLVRLGADDRVRVGTFGRRVEFSPEWTADGRLLLDALPAAIDPDAPTPLWRAVSDAIDLMRDEPGRRVVLVLSDGRDSGPIRFGERWLNQLDIVDRAQREDVMVYGIGLQSRNQNRILRPGENLAAQLAADLPDPGLGRTAEETGGAYMEIRPRQDLGAAFARVADELHSQYLVGFTPPAFDGKTHDIDVRVAVKGFEPRARRSYVAPKR